ncbi:MAG TPA: response regulator [Candidatus Saccharimonadales bacterium]|nr:response regulator [Candidatus Saccharimonadales bacterium]
MSRILLVEDDIWSKDCYEGWLQNHDCVWAGDAQLALNKLDESQIDLIILDMFLPNSNGVQLLNILASYDDFLKIPVIILSTSPPSKKTLKAYGVKDVLDKTTITKVDFVKAVNNALL